MYADKGERMPRKRDMRNSYVKKELLFIWNHPCMDANETFGNQIVEKTT